MQVLICRVDDLEVLTEGAAFDLAAIEVNRGGEQTLDEMGNRMQSARGSHNGYRLGAMQNRSGTFFHIPPDALVIRDRYGDNLEGELKERLAPKKFRPLDTDCDRGG